MPRTTYPTYTTSADIRDDTGFTRNTNVTDENIDIHRERAFAEINSAIAAIYAIPDLDDSNFAWSPASNWLASVELMMWGGYFLIKEYGESWRDTDKDGFRRVKDARDMLKDLQKQRVTLFGNDKTTLPLASDNTINENGGIEWSVNPEATFSVNMEF